MTGGTAEMVRAENVHKSFGHLEVLKGIDLVVRQGEVCVVLGPSGSGKSTFLRCVNHLEKINAGKIYVAGDLIGYRQRGEQLHELREREVAAQRRSIGMVFQRFNLFPHMTALGNIMEAPCRVKREPKGEVRQRALALLDRVGLADKVDSYPGQLSGGQQQRVAIARALVTNPAMLLADEPTGNLDSRTSEEIMGIFQALNDSGKTVVLITHEPDIAQHAKRVVTVRDGVIQHDEVIKQHRVDVRGPVSVIDPPVAPIAAEATS
jgi:polar amino acid transport system ATP-binding protein